MSQKPKNKTKQNRKNDEDIYLLIRNLCKGLKKHGIKKIIGALKKVNIDDSDRCYAIIEFIESAVCKRIGIPRNELYASKTRGEITISRKICMLLMKEHIIELSPEDIAQHYNRTRQSVFEAQKEFRTLKVSTKKNKLHINMIEIFNEINEMVIEFINTTKF